MNPHLFEEARLRPQFDETLPARREDFGAEPPAWGDDPMLILMAREEEEALDH